MSKLEAALRTWLMKGRACSGCSPSPVVEDTRTRWRPLVDVVRSGNRSLSFMHPILRGRPLCSAWSAIKRAIDSALPVTEA